MTDSTQLLIILATTIVGSGLGTSLVGAWFKSRFDAQLETQKALLQRNGKIHERQVETLLEVHAELNDALFDLQRATAAGKFAGEASDVELLNRAGQAMARAADKFSKNSLLFSEKLAVGLRNFFDQSFSAGTTLSLAQSPLLQDGLQRADLWDKARDIAYKQLPPLLTAIGSEARSVIHG